MPSLIRRRTSKDGTVSYMVRVPLPDGTVYSETFSEMKAARVAVGKLVEQREQGVAVRPSSQKLSAWLDEWLGTVRRSLRVNTTDSYSSLIEQRIKPHLGAYPLGKLTRPAIQRFYDAIEADGLSPRTVRYVHSVLHNALEAAVADRRIPRNPSKGVSLPREVKAEMRPFSVEEARAFLAIVDAKDDELDDRRPSAKAKADDAGGVRIAAPMAAFFHVLLSAGLRPSEAGALRWEDVNLEPDDQGRGSITVTRSLSRSRAGEWSVSDPKTKAGRRTVPIPPPTVAALRKHRNRQREHRMKVGAFWQDSGLIFTDAFGQPLDRRNVNHRHFKPSLRKLAEQLHPAGPDGKLSPEAKAARADLMRARMYDLRHTCATLALAAGVNVKVISERLGHASIVITLDTYAHVLPSMQAEAADRLGAALYGS